MGFRAKYDVTVHVARNGRGSLTVDVDRETATRLKSLANFDRHQKYVLETLANAGKRFTIRRAKTGRELQATNRWEFPSDWGASLIHDAWPPTWTRRLAVDGRMDEKGVIRFTLPKVKDCQKKASRTRAKKIPVTEGSGDVFADLGVTREPDLSVERIAELPFPKPAVLFLSPPKRRWWQFLADLFRDERS